MTASVEVPVAVCARKCGVVTAGLAVLAGAGCLGNPADNDPGGPAAVERFQPEPLLRAVAVLRDALAHSGNVTPGPLAVVPQLLSTPWIPTQVGAGRASAELGIPVAFLAPADGDITEQLNILADLVDQGFAGFAVAPVDPAQVEPLILEAHAHSPEIMVLTFERDGVESSLRKLHVGTSQDQAGERLGAALREAVPGARTVLVLTGHADTPAAQARVHGLERGLGAAPGSVLVMADLRDLTVVRKNVQDALASLPDLDAVVALDGYNAAPAVAEVASAGRAVPVLAMDLAGADLDLVASGAVRAAVAQRPYWMGYLHIYVLAALASLGETATRTLLAPYLAGAARDQLDTGVDVLTPADVEAYRAAQREWETGTL